MGTHRVRRLVSQWPTLMRRQLRRSACRRRVIVSRHVVIVASRCRGCHRCPCATTLMLRRPGWPIRFTALQEAGWSGAAGVRKILGLLGGAGNSVLNSLHTS